MPESVDTKIPIQVLQRGQITTKKKGQKLLAQCVFFWLVLM